VFKDCLNNFAKDLQDVCSGEYQNYQQDFMHIRARMSEIFDKHARSVKGQQAIFLKEEYYRKLEGRIRETVGANLENFPDSRCVLHCIRDEIDGIKEGCDALIR